VRKNITRRFPELRALKGCIREKGMSYRKICDDMGMGLTTFSDKINGYYCFNAEEIEKICDILDINSNDVVKYFFPRMFPKHTKSA